jgi:CheY-like chemotaxis protein
MTIERRILIADDDSEIRLGAHDLLSNMGYQVLLAESGDQALTMLRQESLEVIHLVLLDVHMPGRTGLEVFDVMRIEIPKVPIIFWSGAATTAVEQFALESGASAFLRKPIRPALLRDEVSRVLTQHWGAA